MSVTAPKGFVASGVAAGIRRDGRADLAIVRSVPHATGAAMFTRNRVQAACVQVSREHISLTDPQAVVVNSGCANAATGERGKIDALATIKRTEMISHIRNFATNAKLFPGGSR